MGGDLEVNYIQNENVNCTVSPALNFIQSWIKKSPMCFWGDLSVPKGTVNESN